MYDYALIIHPTSEEFLYKFEPHLKNKPRVLIKKLMEWAEPFKAAEIEGLQSILGRTAKGALVMCPLSMELMTTLRPSKVVKSVMDTVNFATSLNTKLIGLTAYIAFAGNKGQELVNLINTPLTTGGSYTLALVPETILRAAELMEIEMDETYILLLGATSSVGKYCIEILSHFACGMFVTAHSKDKLDILLAELPRQKRDKLHLARDINSILNKIKIVIIATNRIPQNVELNKLPPGTVIFDASYPRQIPSDFRDDILVIDGVSIRPPAGKVDFHFDFGLPENLCYPCMAEPMILALERRFENYSLGKDSDATKIKEIIRMAGKHGFEIATLTSHERVISDEEIVKINHNAKKKRKKGFWK